MPEVQEQKVERLFPWTVMSSYNLINGTYTSQSRDLLTTLLRDEWRFKGFVMSDWFGGNNAVEQMRAGNDVLMPGVVFQTEAINKALTDGTLSKEQLDNNVERVLNIVLQSPTFKGNKFSNQPDLSGNARIAREAATEGMKPRVKPTRPSPFTSFPNPVSHALKTTSSAGR